MILKTESILLCTSKNPDTQWHLTLPNKNAVPSYHSLSLVKVIWVSLYCSLYLSYLSFFTPIFPSFSFLRESWSFFPLSTSPASESLCPTITIVNLKLCYTFIFFFILLPSLLKLMPPLLDDSIPLAFLLQLIARHFAFSSVLFKPTPPSLVILHHPF